MTDVTIIIPYNTDRGWLSEAVKSCGKITPVLSPGPGTVGENLNHALKSVRTRFWCQLDEDDMLTPNSIQDRLQFIGDADFIHGRAYNLWPDGSKTNYSLTNPTVTFESCLKRNGIFGSSGLYRTELLDKYGLWREDLTTGEEWEYHLRLLHAGCKIAFCPSYTYIYRRHHMQKSLGKGVDQKKRKLIHQQIRNEYETRRR